MIYDVVVIGGGPAGIMAAGKAALDGASVLLLEKNSELGTKLRLASTGTCSITNDTQRLQFQKKLTSGADFMETALKLFSPRKFLIFLEGLGIAVTYSSAGTVRATETNSVELVDALNSWLTRLKVTIWTETVVTAITSAQSQVTGCRVESGGTEKHIGAKAVILATGGLSFPQTGSSGDGHCMASSLGHEVVAPVQALAPLLLKPHSGFETLAGTTLEGVRLYLWHEGKKIEDRVGELRFTSTSVEGSAAFDCSRAVATTLLKAGKTVVTLDCVPSIDEGVLEQELITLFSEKGAVGITELLTSYVPAPVARCIVGTIESLSPNTTGALVRTADRKKIRAGLKRLELPLSGVAGVEEGVVTAGGVALESINEKTLESYILPGLYYVGELLNVDGYCGGYNLHIAWCTGRLAGASATLASQNKLS